MVDKLIYSIVWLCGLLWLTAWIFPKEGRVWDVLYAVSLIAVLMQLALVLYNGSAVKMRRRMWKRLKGEPTFCDHGFMDTDNCPDCRH